MSLQYSFDVEGSPDAGRATEAVDVALGAVDKCSGVCLMSDAILHQPKRVQLSRAKGWRKPKGVIVVARPSKWGNPYRAGNACQASMESMRAVLVAMFSKDLRAAIDDPWGQPHTIEFRIIAESLHELRGHDLACWCPLDQPCHADVLLALANPVENPDG